MAAKRGGAGGEAAIDMIDRRAGRSIPRHPAPRLPFFKPRSPGPGFILFGRALAIYEPVTQSGQMSCRSDADCSICPNSIQRE